MWSNYHCHTLLVKMLHFKVILEKVLVLKMFKANIHMYNPVHFYSTCVYPQKQKYTHIQTFVQMLLVTFLVITKT